MTQTRNRPNRRTPHSHAHAVAIAWCTLALPHAANASASIEELRALEIARAHVIETRGWSPESYALAVTDANEDEIQVLIIPMTQPECGAHLFGISGCAFQLHIDSQTSEIRDETRIGQPGKNER